MVFRTRYYAVAFAGVNRLVAPVYLKIKLLISIRRKL